MDEIVFQETNDKGFQATVFLSGLACKRGQKYKYVFQLRDSEGHIISCLDWPKNMKRQAIDYAQRCLGYE